MIICTNVISIHALLAESDRLLACSVGSACSFLSTLSLRRATRYGRPIDVQFVISIHALLAESDYLGARKSCDICDFYPRSPCGERLDNAVNFHTKTGFLSTLSLRRATANLQRNLHQKKHFYPRSPCGERQALGLLGWLRVLISIHALLAESDSKSAQNSGALLRIWNKFYGDCIFMLTGKAVFYPFCPCFFHIFWCEGSGNFMIAFPSH